MKPHLCHLYQGTPKVNGHGIRCLTEYGQDPLMGIPGKKWLQTSRRGASAVVCPYDPCGRNRSCVQARVIHRTLKAMQVGDAVAHRSKKIAVIWVTLGII